MWGVTALFATVPFKSHGVVRWIARIIGLAVGVIFLAVAVGSWVTEGAETEITPASVGVFLFCLLVFLGMLAFWRWERLSGLSTLLTGIGLGIFVYLTALDKETMAALTMGLPIMVIGSVFLVVSYTRPSPQTTPGA
jgi:heme A synthase